LSTVGAGLSNDPWAQAAYISQIVDFSTITKEKGLASALETYAAGIFNQVAINSMIQVGGSVGNYFTKKVTTKDYVERIESGFKVRAYSIEDVGHIETATDEFGNEYVREVSLMGKTRTGKFGVDSYGKFGLTTGEMTDMLGDQVNAWQRIENGKQAYVEIMDLATGKTLLVVSQSKEVALTSTMTMVNTPMPSLKTSLKDMTTHSQPAI